VSECPKCKGIGKVKNDGSGFRKSVGLFAVTGIPLLMGDDKKRCTRCYGTGKVKEAK
jgi:hypothetical protein